MNKTRFLCNSLIVLSLTFLATSAPAQGLTVNIGDHPEYTFRKAPFNSRGVQNLQDLRGKPLLIDFWGTQ